MALEKEREFYRQHRHEWLAQHKGKFVLIKDEELIAVCDVIEDAYEEAVQRFGKEPFPIARILDENIP